MLSVRIKELEAVKYLIKNDSEMIGEHTISSREDIRDAMKAITDAVDLLNSAISALRERGIKQ